MKIVTVWMLICALDSINSQLNHLNERPMPDLTIPGAPVHSHSRILDGTPASINDYPWQVAIIYQLDRKRFFCGGSLINDEFVLTAAHCDGAVYHIRVGTNHSLKSNDDQTVQIFKSTEFYPHEQFNSTTYTNDIALIRLPKPAKLVKGLVEPIELDPNPVPDDSELEICGWGVTNNEQPKISPHLNYAKMKLVSNEQCKRYYLYIVPSKMCVQGIEATQNACTGDSGGSMIRRSGNSSLLVGLTSFGNYPCPLQKPTGFTRIEMYIDWIQEKIQQYGNSSTVNIHNMTV